MSLQENKTIQKYISKHYGMNHQSFKIFLQKNLQLSQQQFFLIQQKISQFQIHETFSQNELRVLLRLSATVQNKKNQVKQMSLKQIERCSYALIFKSRKKQTKHQDHRRLPLSEQIVNVKVEQQNLTKSDHYQSQLKPEIQNQYEQKDQKVQTKNQIINNKTSQYMQNNQINKNYQLSSKIDNHYKNPSSQSFLIKQPIKSRAKITQYQKFSTDYVNTVIKFKIQYEDNSVLRRYSQFQKLMKILGDKFQGYILPQMPPKQAIKSGMSYFWGVDETFLQQRKNKLQQLLNRLLQSKFVSSDQTLNKFLTDSGYQIQLVSQGYATYLKSFTDIVFNAKQLKDYGIAYYNYLKQKGNVKLNSDLQNKYEDIQEILKTFIDINQYRKKINLNFQKRKQIFNDQGIPSRKQGNLDFNKMMNKIEDQIKNIATEFGKYRDLKSRQSWIKQLIRQKTSDGSRGLNDLNEQKKKLESRIQKMQTNLKIALDDFNQSKKEQIKVIGPKLLDWRKNVHP